MKASLATVLSSAAGLAQAHSCAHLAGSGRNKGRRAIVCDYIVVGYHVVAHVHASRHPKQWGPCLRAGNVGIRPFGTETAEKNSNGLQPSSDGLHQQNTSSTSYVY